MQIKGRDEMMLQRLAKFLRDEGGNTAVEYALIALIVAVGIIPALKALPPVLQTLFESFGPNLVN